MGSDEKVGWSRESEVLHLTFASNPRTVYSVDWSIRCKIVSNKMIMI